jgi:hypothetical protein
MRSHMNSRRSRGPKPNRRRALELLAGSRDGMTEAGLATAKTERMVAGGRPMEVARVRITTPADGRSWSVPSSPRSHDPTDSQTRVGFSSIRRMGRGRRAR